MRNKELKSVENKRFPGAETVWTAVSIPGFFRLGSLRKLAYRKKSGRNSWLRKLVFAAPTEEMFLRARF